MGLYEAWMRTSLPPLPIRLIFGRLVFAAVQPGPEFLVLGAVLEGLIDEHAVVPALDFVERVSQGGQEIVVGGDDRAVDVELDHGLGLADGGDLAGVVGVLQLLLGHVRGILDDLERLAVEVEDRVVRGLDPDLLAPLADPLVFRRLVLAAVELWPRTPCIRGCA